MERAALLIQLQPITPWRCHAARYGEPASMLASDTFFGALSFGMEELGWRKQWLAEGTGAARISSLFPMQGDQFFAPLPEILRNYSGLRRVRLESVRFAPPAAIGDLAARRFDENRWILDMASGCLLHADRGGAGGPYRTLTRRRAAVDRLNGTAAPAEEIEGVDFNASSGLWGLVVFASRDSAAEWAPKIKGVCRLLADSGIGGWRTAGWGRARRPRFREGSLGSLTSFMGWRNRDSSPEDQETGTPPAATSWYALGLFNPDGSDPVEWSAGAYRTMMRSGWTTAREAKSPLRFVREGSIISCSAEPAGRIAYAPVNGHGTTARYGAGLVLPWREEGAL